MKNKFFGIYYKHQTIDGYTLAVISSTSNEGDMIQVIDNEKSYQIKDIKSVSVSFVGISFDIHQEDISITGSLTYGPLSKPKKDIMSYYRYLPIECKHNIYSMYHSLSGTLNINGKDICFDNGNGYMEGDQGRNFPKEYLWFNSVSKDCSITLAIADIPLGLFHIQGITCLVKHGNDEYRFGTYNNAKVLKRSKNHIVIRKGKYRLEIKIDDFEGYKLKAPIKGDMVRHIHECPSVNARYTLYRNDEVLIDSSNKYASYEYVYGDN